MNSNSTMTAANPATMARPSKTPKVTSSNQYPKSDSVRSGAGAAPGPSRQDKETKLSGNGKPSREIVFRIDNGAAGEVLLAGSFTGWNQSPITMRRVGEGSWETKVLLPPGRYHYKFLVDGAWQDDPCAKEYCPNPFGTRDCVLEIS
jgi:Glycogen recognition site of AMP-activated protein kinase